MRIVTLCIASGLVVAAAPAGDWIIGGSDPNESVTLTEDRLVDGSLLVLNRGRLHVTAGARLTVTGDVIVANEGRFELDGASLHFPQAFAYQSGLVATDRGQIVMADATLDGGGHSYSVFVAGQAGVHYERVEVVQGFSTWVVADDAGAELLDCVNAGEFLQPGASSLSITGSDTVLYWIVAPDGSTFDLTLPPPGDVASFGLDPNTPDVAGIAYQMQLTDCTNVLWAIMARSGSNVTIHDSELFAVGTWFDRANAVEIRGVANQAGFADQRYDWGDVHYRFVNTSVQTWNFYPYGQTQLTLEDSVFGEIGCAEQGQATVIQSLCNGSGGYISAGDQSFCVLLASTNLSQTTVTGNATMIFADSSIASPQIDALDASVLLLLNTDYPGEPAAHDAATIFDASVGWQRVPAGEPVELRGSARIIPGPESPVVFEGYGLEFGTFDDPNVWTPIVESPDPVRHDALGFWDTCGRVPGTYAVRLTLLHNLGDPIRIRTPITLAEVPGACPPGDLDCDGQVGLSDLARLLTSFGADGNGDLTGDAWTDLTDLSVLLSRFGQSCP